MGMPTPSQLIEKCNNLESCFQALYNFFFGILVALAFVYFLWGAIEYLLSGSTFTSKDSGKKKMINSIIAIIVTLLIPVIVYWINPEIFGEHQLNVYEYQGDAYNVDSPTGIGGECQAAPGSGLIYLRDLRLSNIIDVTGSACIKNKIEDKLKDLDRELANYNRLKNLNFKIYITQGYNGTSSHYDPCHKDGRALDIVIEERNNICRWNDLIGIIRRIDPDVFIITEALCPGPINSEGLCIKKCAETTRNPENNEICQIIWCQTAYTTGSPQTRAKHLHVCFPNR